MTSTPSSALLLVAASLLLSRPAAAQPPYGSLALRWDNCFTDGGTAAHSFACNTNSLPGDVLILSAWAPVDMPQLNGAATALTLWSLDATLPSWWQLYAGGCRGTAGITAQFTPPLTSTNCVDTWLGQAAGGMNFAPGYSNTARIRTVCAISGSTSVTAGQELFIARVVILHSKTTGTGSCGGCLDGACIGLESVLLTQPSGVGDYTILLPYGGSGTDFVGWQSPVNMPESVFPYHGSYMKDFTSCSAATPARRPTWGAVKSLYR